MKGGGWPSVDGGGDVAAPAESQEARDLRLLAQARRIAARDFGGDGKAQIAIYERNCRVVDAWNSPRVVEERRRDDLLASVDEYVSPWRRAAAELDERGKDREAARMWKRAEDDEERHRENEASERRAKLQRMVEVLAANERKP